MKTDDVREQELSPEAITAALDLIRRALDSDQVDFEIIERTERYVAWLLCGNNPVTVITQSVRSTGGIQVDVHPVTGSLSNKSELVLQRREEQKAGWFPEGSCLQALAEA